MNIAKELDIRKDLLYCCRRLAGEELLKNGRSKAYLMRVKEISQLQEEIDILRYCLTREDFPSVAEVYCVHKQTTKAEGSP